MDKIYAGILGYIFLDVEEHLRKKCKVEIPNSSKLTMDIMLSKIILKYGDFSIGFYSSIDEYVRLFSSNMTIIDARKILYTLSFSPLPSELNQIKIQKGIDFFEKEIRAGQLTDMQTLMSDFKTLNQ